MYVVLTSVPLEPDRRDEALDLFAELAERSRGEPGVEEYHATTDVSDPNVVRFVEQYEDADAAEAHTGTDHYERFVEQLPEFVAGEMETTQFAVDGDVHTATFGPDALD